MNDDFPLFDLVQTPGTVTHAYASAAGKGSVRGSAVSRALLASRLDGMRRAAASGDEEAFQEIKQAALMEQGGLLALDAINGSPEATQDLLQVLKGSFSRARRLRNKAGVALASLYALGLLSMGSGDDAIGT